MRDVRKYPRTEAINKIVCYPVISQSMVGGVVKGLCEIMTVISEGRKKKELEKLRILISSILRCLK